MHFSCWVHTNLLLILFFITSSQSSESLQLAPCLHSDMTDVWKIKEMLAGICMKSLICWQNVFFSSPSNQFLFLPVQSLPSPGCFRHISAAEAFNHVCQTAVPLSRPDPSRHRSALWTSAASLWPFNKHERWYIHVWITKWAYRTQAWRATVAFTAQTGNNSESAINNKTVPQKTDVEFSSIHQAHMK